MDLWGQMLQQEGDRLVDLGGLDDVVVVQNEHQVVVDGIENSSRSRNGTRRSRERLGSKVPIAEMQWTALHHDDPWVRRSCLEGWRNQQLARNLAFATINAREAEIRRFVAEAGEYPWRWSAQLVDERLGDQRSCATRRSTVIR